jgi:hypothetical protein
MQKDEANKVVFEHLEQDETQRAFIKYCRACELACPVGKSLFAIDTQAP